MAISSDAAVEPYPGWGGYGSSKAALDQLSAVLAAEEPDLQVYAVDPGDMRTEMHQVAFPGEDISDRPEPETVVRRCSGSSGASRRAGATVPLTAPRDRRDGDRSRAFELPAGATHRPPERRGLAGRRAAAGGGPAGSSTAASANCRRLLAPGDLVVVNTRAPCRRRWTALRRGAPAPVHVAAAARRRQLGGRGPAPGQRRAAADLAARRRLGCPAASTATCWRRPAPGPTARLWRAHVAGVEDALAYLARHGRPIRYGYVRDDLPAGRLPERLRPAAGQRRDAERGPAVHRTARGRAGDPRRRGRAGRAAHRGLEPGARTSRRSPERFVVPPTTARLVNADREGGGRVVAVGTTVVRALETCAEPGGPWCPAPAGPTWCSAPTGRRGW